MTDRALKLSIFSQTVSSTEMTRANGFCVTAKPLEQHERSSLLKIFIVRSICDTLQPPNLNIFNMREYSLRLIPVISLLSQTEFLKVMSECNVHQVL